MTANIPGVRVPMGFGVPFHYYKQHMQQNHLDARVDAMLGDPQWANPAWRKTQLEAMRKAIMDAPIDEATLDAIYKRVRVDLGGVGVFVRSSSNSEDLPGFNGAGLYDTQGNVVGKKQLGEALKYVWASLWNQRAVEEREAFGIDHHQVYMAVLVQIGINATAAGVLVTKDLWDPSDDHSFTINAKWGLGERVVQGQKSPEQIVFDPTNDGTKIISRSDDPIMLKFDEHGGIKEEPVPAGQDVILSEARAKKLSTMVAAFVPVFTHGQPLDVEWVLEGDDFWIVQARPFVGKVDVKRPAVLVVARGVAPGCDLAPSPPAPVPAARPATTSPIAVAVNAADVNGSANEQRRWRWPDPVTFDCIAIADHLVDLATAAVASDSERAVQTANHARNVRATAETCTKGAWPPA